MSYRRRNITTIGNPAICAGILLLLLFFSPIMSLQPTGAEATNITSRLSGKIRGFQIPEYYPAKPGQKALLRSLLSGREAQPVGKGKIQITGLRIECYDREGTTNTVITTAGCFYEMGPKMVTSRERIRLSRTDGSMYIEGQGFSWDHAQSLIVISNQVASEFEGLDVSGFSSNPPSSSTNETTRVRVTSDQFTFAQKENNAQYLGRVHVTEKDTRLRCNKLQLFAAGSTNGFEQIAGEGDVSFNVEKPDQKFDASGDQFIYVRAQNELAISGNVKWNGQAQKGSADFVTLRQNGNDLSATGNVLMELDKGGLSQGDLVGIPMASGKEQNQGVLTSQSDNLNSITNQISLFGNVLVKDNDATLQCDTLNIHFLDSASSNQPEQPATDEADAPSSSRQIELIEALGKVKIAQQDHRIETEKALYKPLLNQALFQSHTRWFSTQLTGESDQLLMWTTPRHAKASGNVKVLMPVEGKIQPLELFGPLGSTNTTASTPQATSAKPNELQITSPQMDVDEEQVLFYNKVLAEILPADTEITHITMDRLELNFKEKPLPPSKSETSPQKSTSRPRYLDTIYARGSVLVSQTTLQPEPKTQQMSSDLMSVQLDPQTGTAQNVIAQDHVEMKQEDVVATGKKAVFDTATQLLELTGDPVAKIPKGTLYADKMIWDRKANVFKGVSKFRIDGQKPQ